jgi:dephospho-CoA kinase
MIKIGILGDIGSGKSFVSKQFGLPIFNADKEVKNIYNNDRSCFIKLRKKLPKFINSFPIKKKNLIKAILSNIKNLREINKIIHPIVRKKMNKFFLKNFNQKAVILDIPLLLENKINTKSYILIFVDAKKKNIEKNLKTRKYYNRNLLNKLRKIQISLNSKKKLSNFIIENNFKSKPVKNRVKIIKKKILNS